MVEYFLYEDNTRLSWALSDHLASELQNKIDENGKAGLVVSCHLELVPTFELLSQKDIDWSRVWVTLADECLVPVEHEDSREGQIYRCLLKNKAKDANFLSLLSCFNQGQRATDKSEGVSRLDKFPFDFLVSSMGKDGHVGGLFPRAKGLDDAVSWNGDRYFVKIRPESTPHEWITLTLPTLVRANEIILCITGKTKKLILAKAFQEGSLRQMPIRYLLRHAKRPIKVYWSP